MKTKQIQGVLRVLAGAGLAVSAACWAFGQSAPAAKPLEFEVASVKPSAPAVDGRVMRRIGGDPGMVNYTNATLIMLIARAYGVKDYQVSGPDWFDNMGYDVVAKVPAGAATDQIPAMMQTMLAERFKLALHRETKSIPVYALIAAKNGLKMKETDPALLGPGPAAAPGRGGPGSGPGIRMMVTDAGRELKGEMTMAQLTNAMSNFMDRPVLDMTGLKGTYDIDITWSPDETDQMRMKLGAAAAGAMGGPPPAAGGGPGADKTPDAPVGSIFSVVQDKLGLKLDPRKSDAEILVIDHAEKVPTEN